jgi:hypothetical protein
VLWKFSNVKAVLFSSTLAGNEQAGLRSGAAVGTPSDRIADRGRWEQVVRWLLIGFLIAHGLIHVAIWAPKSDSEKAPFDASHSWLIGDQRPLALMLAFTAAALLLLAAVALWSTGGWWRPTGVVGLSVSTVLLLLYFTPWYLFILPINIALIVGIAFMDWPSKATVGA